MTVPLRTDHCLAGILLGMLALSLTACDGSPSDLADPPGPTPAVRVTGTAGNGAGAVVTASAITPYGFRDLPGSATTNAYGEFSLNLNTAPEIVVLTAQLIDRVWRVPVTIPDSSSTSPRPLVVVAAPMTQETTASADVYLIAARVDPYVTPADIQHFSASTNFASSLNLTLGGARALAQAMRAESLAAPGYASAARARRLVAYRAGSIPHHFGQEYERALVRAGASEQTYARASQAQTTTLTVFTERTLFTEEIQSPDAFNMRRIAELKSSRAIRDAVIALSRHLYAPVPQRVTTTLSNHELVLIITGTEVGLRAARAAHDNALAEMLDVKFGLTGSLGASLAATSSLHDALKTAIASAASADDVAQAYAAFFASAPDVIRSTVGKGLSDFNATAAGAALAILVANS